ncbi:AhpA/YtjB family protein [uncultured Ferrimonas sp.]|uniref:AhpA/YtjB family protein n=1 Tax=uncultured Ferrimonas sp. TaxID=432640 RepID=UPI002637A6E8|nr:AhpA/YtjB family protein [uncultured Ferrimonas sp.]
MSSSPRRRNIILPRLAQVLLALTLLITILLLWQQQRTQVEQLLERQGQRVTDQLLKQASHSAATALKSDDDELLQWLVQNLVSEPEVVSATVFNYQGHKLASAQSLFPEAQLPEQERIEQALQHFAPYTIAVAQQQQAYGYLRLRINSTLLQKEGRLLHRQQQQQLGLLLLSSGLIGFLLARAFSFKRARISWLRLRAKQIKASKKTD